MFLHPAHQLLAGGIIQALHGDAGIQEPLFRALEAAPFADHHATKSKQHSRACAHRTGGEGGDQGELLPVAPAPGVADALGFAVAGGITVLHPLVVAPGRDRAVFAREHRADRNASFAPALLCFLPRRLE